MQKLLSRLIDDGRTASNESPATLVDLDQTGVPQLSVCFDRRRWVDSKLGGDLADRRKLIPGLQDTRGNEVTNAVHDLPVDGNTNGRFELEPDLYHCISVWVDQYTCYVKKVLLRCCHEAAGSPSASRYGLGGGALTSCAIVLAEHHRGELDNFAGGKLMRSALQDFSCSPDRRRLDDCSRQVMNMRDRHVATVSHGAEHVACEILHHW